MLHRAAYKMRQCAVLLKYRIISLVIKDLVYEAKAKAKTFFSRPRPGHKKFSRPRQGHIISKPTSRPTETATIRPTQPFALQLLRQNNTYLIKHNAKETTCDGFGVQY